MTMLSPRLTTLAICQLEGQEAPLSGLMQVCAILSSTWALAAFNPPFTQIVDLCKAEPSHLRLWQKDLSLKVCNSGSPQYYSTTKL